MASILDVIKGGGYGSGLGTALTQTRRNFINNPVVGEGVYSPGYGSTFGGGGGGSSYPGFDPSSGRGGSMPPTGGGYQAGQHVQPNLSRAYAQMPHTPQGQQIRGQFQANTSPLTSYLAQQIFGGGASGGAGGGGFGSFMGGGTIAPGGGGGGQLDTNALYSMFGISPVNTGYRTPLANISSRFRGQGGPGLQVYEDYAHGPQRASFSSRFGEYA